MSNARTHVQMIAALISLSNVGLASDELPDPDFLEWLGMTAEVEELGVDVDSLISSRKDESEDVPEQEAAK